MFDILADFNRAVFHIAMFIIIVVIGTGFAFGIVQGIFHAIVSRTKPPSPDQKCAYCPRTRRKGHISCNRCGKSPLFLK